MATKPGIKLDMQQSVLIKALGMRGNRLQQVASETLNDAGERMDEEYKDRLQAKQKIRTKFTLNAPKLFKSSPIRSSGEPRALKDINVKYGIRVMRGGKEHYLSRLERGVMQRGNQETLGRVPIPLQRARTSNNDMKPVSSPLRLTKGKTQTLKVGGDVIGVRRDKFKSNSRRWGALYGAKKAGTIEGDAKKPFFFIDNQGDLGIFKFFGKIARKIRTLTQTSARTPSSPNFRDSFRSIRRTDIQRDFVAKAGKALKRLK